MKKFLSSKEELIHFQCKNCNKQWSVGDAPDRRYWFCPWCGNKLESERMSDYDTDNKWDIRFMQLAEHIASWSKDPSTKVGAVIVDHRHRILSLGFNGYPQYIPDDDLHDREKKYAKIIHAEMNAILFAQRELSGCIIYVWPMAPCSQCASAIIQSGIECVVTRKATPEQYERWGDKIKLTEEMFESANVTLEYI